MWNEFYAMWCGLTPSQKADFLKVLIPTIGAVSGAIVSIIIFSRNKKKEIQFKIHEQRKEKYEQYLKLIQKIMINSKKINKGNLSTIEQSEWLNAHFGLILYASDKVYRKALNATRNAEEYTPSEMLFEMGALIQLMRKEVGLSSKEEITIRECLSIFITDINDKKYDKQYEEYMKTKARK